MENVQVTLIGRENCHLCDDAVVAIDQTLQEFRNVTLEQRLIDEDPEWVEFYSDKVPVILIEGVEHGYWRVNDAIFRGALVQAGALPQQSESE